MKLPSRVIQAERFDQKGRKIESVDIAVNQVGDRVYLSIQGKARIIKSFVMSGIMAGTDSRGIRIMYRKRTGKS